MMASPGASPTKALLDTSHLQCPICLETLVEPVETDCGHAFCEECLLESVRQTPHCPTCRLRITGVIPSYTLRHIVANQQVATKSHPGTAALVAPFGTTKSPEPAYKPVATNGDLPPLPHPPMSAIHAPRGNTQNIVKTVRVDFVPRHPLLCTGGGFDPGNVFLAEGLNEFLTPTEFSDFVTEVNGLARKWTPSWLDCWVLGCLLWPLGGCCVLCWWADSAKDKLRDYVNDANKESQPKGYMWALKSDENTTCELDEHYFLEMTMDSRWRVDTFNTPKTRQIHQLVHERSQLENVLRSRGVRLMRTVSGHVHAFSPTAGARQQTPFSNGIMTPDSGSRPSSPLNDTGRPPATRV